MFLGEFRDFKFKFIMNFFNLERYDGMQPAVDNRGINGYKITLGITTRQRK
jgi:hypothetical protein